MSYCRFSSDDFQSDVYVYEHCDGYWATHVAARRHVFDRAGLPEIGSDDDTDGWFARHAEVSRRLESAELVDIDLPHAGEDFQDDSPGACADRLESLRALGYYVPQYAIDELREEAAA